MTRASLLIAWAGMAFIAGCNEPDAGPQPASVRPMRSIPVETDAIGRPDVVKLSSRTLERYEAVGRCLGLEPLAVGNGGYDATDYVTADAASRMTYTAMLGLTNDHFWSQAVIAPARRATAANDLICSIDPKSIPAEMPSKIKVYRQPAKETPEAVLPYPPLPRR